MAVFNGSVSKGTFGFTKLCLALFIGVPAVCWSANIAPGQGIDFSQVTWSFPGASGDGPSGTGQVDVNLSQLIASSGISSGFINITTASGWVTQNLPVLPGFTYNDLTTTFNLGSTGGVVTNLGATVTYTATPMTSAPIGVPDTFAVGSTETNAQGQGPNLAAAPAPPAVAGINFPGGLFGFAFQPNHPNIEAANNQCGPAAAANSLDWLKTTYGVPIPNTNVLGLKGDNSLVGKLDTSMNRTVTDRATGNGLNVEPQLEGLLSYLSSVNINGLTVKHQGLSPFGGDTFTGANNVTVGGITSQGRGTIVDPNFIISEIRAGEDVLFGDDHHVVDIVGAGTILGAPFILYVSDHLQTAKDAMGNFINDNKGTGMIDFSFIVPQAGGQPKLVYGDQNGATAVDVISVSVPEPVSLLLLLSGLIALLLRARRSGASCRRAA